MSFKYLNVKCRLLSIKLFLKRLNDRSKSTGVIGAYLKRVLSEGNNSKVLEGWSANHYVIDCLKIYKAWIFSVIT